MLINYVLYVLEYNKVESTHIITELLKKTRFWILYDVGQRVCGSVCQPSTVYYSCSFGCQRELIIG